MTKSYQAYVQSISWCFRGDGAYELTLCAQFYVLFIVPFVRYEYARIVPQVCVWKLNRPVCTALSH